MGRSFTANSGTRTEVLPKGRSSTAKPRNQGYSLLGMNRRDSFPLFSAPNSLFSIWTDFKRSEKIPGASAWRWGEWIWPPEPSGLYRNSSQGLNISSIRVFDQIRDPEIQITLRPQKYKYHLVNSMTCGFMNEYIFLFNWHQQQIKYYVTSSLEYCQPKHSD